MGRRSFFPLPLNDEGSRRHSAGLSYSQLHAFCHLRGRQAPRSAPLSAPRSRVNHPPAGRRSAKATYPWVGSGGQGGRRALFRAGEGWPFALVDADRLCGATSRISEARQRKDR